MFCLDKINKKNVQGSLNPSMLVEHSSVKVFQTKYFMFLDKKKNYVMALNV